MLCSPRKIARSRPSGLQRQFRPKPGSLSQTLSQNNKRESGAGMSLGGRALSGRAAPFYSEASCLVGLSLRSASICLGLGWGLGRLYSLLPLL